MHMYATRCMPARSGCSSEFHSHWERGGGLSSLFHVVPSSSGAFSTRKRSCGEIFGGTRNIRKGCAIVSFRVFGKSDQSHYGYAEPYRVAELADLVSHGLHLEFLDPNLNKSHKFTAARPLYSTCNARCATSIGQSGSKLLRTRHRTPKLWIERSIRNVEPSISRTSSSSERSDTSSQDAMLHRTD